MTKDLAIGIFGATGIVGRAIIGVLKNRNFPVTTMKLYASERSEGMNIKTEFGDIVIENSEAADFKKLNIAFFAISGDWSKANAQKAIDAGCIVIDNSSAFRYDENVPLIIPEINSDALNNASLIANPNCTTAIASIPLYQIYKHYGLKKVIISTYQATSGAGNSGMKELEKETKNYLEGKEIHNSVFQHPIPFNVIPHIDMFQDNLYTKEEMKVVRETQKILGDDQIRISCTCVRIPTFRAHSESIVVETKDEVDAADVQKIFSDVKGIEVKDNPGMNIYPMPLTASNKYDVEVGRIRNNLVFGNHGIEFFVSGDQILKGAALNAVQIAELVVNERFMHYANFHINQNKEM